MPVNAANGQIIWNYTTATCLEHVTTPIAGCPVVAGGAVYFGSGDGNVYAVNATTVL